MKNVSFRKLSILGLVLLAASAVTAAIVPSKTKKPTVDPRGFLVPSEGGDHQTCRTPGVNPTNCTNTASGVGQNSGTTDPGAGVADTSDFTSAAN